MMTAAELSRHKASQVDLVRSWQCSRDAAFYCPLHGDCTCERGDNRDGLGASWSLACPLHGADSTHPDAEELVR